METNSSKPNDEDAQEGQHTQKYVQLIQEIDERIANLKKQLNAAEEERKHLHLQQLQGEGKFKIEIANWVQNVG